MAVPKKNGAATVSKIFIKGDRDSEQGQAGISHDPIARGSQGGDSAYNSVAE